MFQNYGITGIILHAFLLLVFGSHCQMAPAAAGSTRQLELGTGHVYQLTSTLLLSEPHVDPGKDVGYQVTADVTIGTIWESSADRNDKLIQVEVANPQLFIKSRKAPAPEGFVAHTSEITNLNNGAYLIHWTSGRIASIYVAKDEVKSVVNLKKGIASLFQYQLLDMETNETDASGFCQVVYKSLDQATISKEKKNCLSTAQAIPYIFRPDKLLGTTVSSERRARIVLTRDNSALKSIETEESHIMTVNIKQEAASQVHASQQLLLTDKYVKMIPVKGENVQAAVMEVGKNLGLQLIQQSLILELEDIAACPDQICPTLMKTVKENLEALDEKFLGTMRSSAAFVRMLPIARTASREDFIAVLKSNQNTEDNKDVFLALCDLAGAAQTYAAYEAISKVARLDGDVDLEAAERYLWAVSHGSQANEDILKDLLRLSEKKYEEEKLSETLLLTVAGMARRLAQRPNQKSKLAEQVQASIENGLSRCASDDELCRLRFLRAMKNLGSSSTASLLLEHAIRGTRKTSVAAMKALVSLPKEAWNQTVQIACERIFFQIGRRYDSSARTLALDILLEAEPGPGLVLELLYYLRTPDPVYEVKQYLLQRLVQTSEKNLDFHLLMRSLLRAEGSALMNYHTFAQRGLSTAFTRHFLNGHHLNGSLISIQEISGGLLKRGIVDVSLENGGETSSIFTLGLFAGGLSSFISSDSESAGGASGEADEEATAGMEVTILGAQIRPFVFFSGQGELMGHVWSGTASTRTPAFQALSLLQDHRELLPLQTGFIADLTILGAMSFELAGETQLSLWNRNAHALVEKNAGLSLIGLTRVDSTFVRSQIELNLATEAKLNLVSNLDFYGGMSLCMQLKQPESILKHNVYKVERIPGSKHRLRKSRYTQYRIPGRTYALNRKNNEMCNLIFKNQ